MNEGFLRAHERLKRIIVQGDVPPMETFIPLFETLHWAVAAKLESKLTGHEKKLARAIRFARNRVGHQWAAALHLQDMPFPTVRTNLVTSRSRVIAPPVVATWCWQPVSRLPVPRDPKYRDEKVGKPLYRQHLSGRPALEALDAIAAAL